MELAVFLCFIRIAIYDFKNHLIRNIDLLIVAIFAFPLYWRNWWIALANLSIYSFIWLINKGKLEFVLSSLFVSLSIDLPEG